MIKLLGLLFSVTVVNGQNFHYLLPDDASLYEDWLTKTIKKSTSSIFISTPSMDYPSLRKALIKHQEHGQMLHMSVQQSKDDPLYLVQYQGTDLSLYRSRELQDTIIIFDPYVCHLSSPLNQEMLTSTASIVWCSDDPDTLSFAKKTFATLAKRSKRYLK